MAKFNKDSVFGTFTVISAFCLVCSVLVSSAVVALGPFQKAAIVNDRQTSILKVSGYEIQKTVTETYNQHIQAKLLDVETGNFVEDPSLDADNYNFASLAKNPETSTPIPAEIDYGNIRTRAKYMPIYYAVDELGNKTRIILPFYGQALWSTVYGYIALSTDGNTIESVTFYQHGETPGLGGEIDNPRWQSIWVGKKIVDENGEFKFKITKAPDHQGDGKDFDVDSLSGATLTSNGVQNAVAYWMGQAYAPFLEKVRNGEIE